MTKSFMHAIRCVFAQHCAVHAMIRPRPIDPTPLRPTRLGLCMVTEHAPLSCYLLGHWHAGRLACWATRDALTHQRSSLLS